MNDSGLGRNVKRDLHKNLIGTKTACYSLISLLMTTTRAELTRFFFSRWLNSIGLMPSTVQVSRNNRDGCSMQMKRSPEHEMYTNRGAYRSGF